MSVFADITAFAVGSSGEDLATSNAFTRNTSLTGVGTGNVKVSTGSPNFAWGDSDSAAYLHNTTPGSANQTVKAVIKKGATTPNMRVTLMARAAGTSWIEVTYALGDDAMTIFEWSGGGISNLTGYQFPGVPISTTGTLELVLNGTSASMWLTPNGGSRAQIGSTVTVSVTQVGRVGLRANVISGTPTSTDGLFWQTFYAEDDTAGGGGGGHLRKIQRQLRGA